MPEVGQNDKILTIGIPTFNRPEKLLGCLRSVISQCRDDIEILVSDNSENDLSEIAVRELNVSLDERFKIRYIKNKTNLGLDKNFYNIVLQGAGKYIQWLSDDDELLPGSVDKVVNTIAELNDSSAFIFLNPIGFIDRDGIREWKKRHLALPDNILTTDIEGSIDKFDHYITFVSSYCFDRISWLKNEEDNEFFGTNLYLTYGLINYLGRNKQVFMFADPIVAHRYDYTGNFPVLKPFTIELQKAMINHARKNSLDVKKLKRTYGRILGSQIFGLVMGLKLGYFKDLGRFKPFEDVMSPCWKFPIFWYKILPVLLVPSNFFKFAQYIKRKLLK